MTDQQLSAFLKIILYPAVLIYVASIFWLTFFVLDGLVSSGTKAIRNFIESRREMKDRQEEGK